MFKKFQSLVVFSLLICLVLCQSVRANPESEKVAVFAAKVKTEIAKLGTGTAARVKVKLRDDTKLNGYVKATNENGFVVVDDKIGAETEIRFRQVKNVKGRNNLTGRQIAAVAGFVVLVLIIVSCATTDCV